MKNNVNKKNSSMLSWMKDLFPYCRSITGEGIRASYAYFKKINPEFKLLKFKSGKKVFDWTVPNEWIIKDAYIQNISSGKKFANFKSNNLHLINYSIKKNTILPKSKILKKIYTLKNQPSAIPYVTSYYKKDWGFCMSEKQKKKLPNGNYKVFIDSNFKRGSLDLMELVLPGKSKKEIFFSTYLCHPSMANNELSGPVLLNKIIQNLKKKKNNFTYRFVILPETIGSISYLSKRMNILKKNLIAGFVLTCVGDEKCYSLTKSRNGNSISDYLVERFLKKKTNFKIYSYLDRISDERQYCSPNIDLPVSTFSRSREFKEYHTNKDDFNLVTSKGLNQSYKFISQILNFIEKDLYNLKDLLFPKSKIFAEPFLTKKNLYKTISIKTNYTIIDNTKIILDILSYSDGKTNIFELGKKINLPQKKLIRYLKLLKKFNYIKF